MIDTDSGCIRYKVYNTLREEKRREEKRREEKRREEKRREEKRHLGSRNYIFVSEGSQAVQAHPSGRGKASERN
jgi:hypothetical protein